MDSTTVAMPQPSPLLPSRGSRISSNSVTMGRGRPAIGILSSGFCDQGHQQYYSSTNRRSPSLSTAVMSVINKGMNDRPAKLKLLKVLTSDLSTFSQMGFGLDSDALVDQVNRGMMSEAADVFLGRLQKLREEEKKLKMKRKEEKARLKASQMQTSSIDCEEESSSSSSESSSSDCDQVIDIKSSKQTHIEEQQNGFKQLTLNKENLPDQAHDAEATDLAVENSIAVKKIKVCMGGKCKKSGAAMLMEEFKKAVGMEGEVSSCKCMGKCKEGPNVKVVNGPLCKGVGMEDVGIIVSKFLVENENNEMGFAAAG